MVGCRAEADGRTEVEEDGAGFEFFDLVHEGLDLSLEVGNGLGRFLVHRPSARRRKSHQP
jgi:hypothetical protein